MFDPYGEEPDAPKEVSQIRRLLDGLIYEDHEQAIEVLDRLMAQDDYGKRICKQIIFPIISCTSEPIRKACLERMLDFDGYKPHPGTLVDLIISCNHYDLMPSLIERNHLPEKIDENLKFGLVTALKHAWSYPDVLCPDIFLDEYFVSPLAVILLQLDPLDTDRMEKILAMPMYEGASNKFNNQITQRLSNVNGESGFAKTFEGSNGKRLGLLIKAGLLDPVAIGELKPDNLRIQNILREAQTWLLQDATPSAPGTGRAVRL